MSLIHDSIGSLLGSFWQSLGRKAWIPTEREVPTRPTSLSGPDLGSTTNLLAHLLVSISELKSKLKSELKPWTVDAQHHPQEGRNICISFISLSSLQKAINSRRRAKL